MRIFICYRRGDSPDVAARIYDRLVQEFQTGNVYYDLDSIPFGADFRNHIESLLQTSDVMLVVIGPQWLRVKSGKRRIDDPGDYVRIEVEAALRRGIRVIPTLVGGAAIPSPNDLPDVIEPLAFRHGIPVRQDPDFHGDMNRLINSLTRPAPPNDTVVPAPTDASRPRPPGRQWKLVLAATAAVLVVTSLVIWRTAGGAGPASQPTDVPSSIGTTGTPAARTFAVRREINTAADPRDLEMDGNDLLVSFASGLLQRIDPNTGRVMNSMDFGYPGGNDLLENSGELR